MDDLIAKIKAAAVVEPADLVPAMVGTSVAKPSRTRKPQPRPFRQGDALVIIGTSTGGPRALRQLLTDLPANLNAAVVVIQHMPPGFTTALAQTL